MHKIISPNYTILLDLPIAPYKQIWRLQYLAVIAKRVGLVTEDIFILCEHQPVFTLGNKGGKEHLKVPLAFLERKGIPVFQTERGGSITFHGPGQLVGYPILDLDRKGLGPVDLVWALEEIMIKVSSDLGVPLTRVAGMRGVWMKNKKVGSVGIAVSKGISYHGFSLNVMLDLRPFSWIDPCGLSGITMTNLTTETGAKISMEEMKKSAARHAREILGIEFRVIALDQLHDMLVTNMQCVEAIS